MCKHPLKGFQIGYHPSGKPMYKITSYSVDHVELVGNTWIPCFKHDFMSQTCKDRKDDFIEIPCNRCIDCRLKRSREWANRCMMELAFYEPSECWFVTLTYDDAHIMTYGNDIDVFDHTLMKKDLQDFWKRLRIHAVRNESCNRKIRYFACGEYGDKTFRPHYHAIIYGIPWIDINSWEMSKSGNKLFRSPILEKIWSNGIVCVSPVTWNTCAYTARYTMKKSNGRDNDFYLDIGLEPEFLTMSRRPGIARDYYELHKDHIYEFDEIILKGDKDALKIKPPHYFDSLYEADDPAAYANIKERRESCVANNNFWKMSQTDLEYLDQLQVEENELISRLKGLYRNKI